MHAKWFIDSADIDDQFKMSIALKNSKSGKRRAGAAGFGDVQDDEDADGPAIGRGQPGFQTTDFWRFAAFSRAPSRTGDMQQLCCPFKATPSFPGSSDGRLQSCDRPK